MKLQKPRQVSSVPPPFCQHSALSGRVKTGAPGQTQQSRNPPSGEWVNMAKAPNTFRMHRCHLSWLTTAPLSAIWVYYRYISPHIMMFSLALVLWDQPEWKTAGEASRWQFFHLFLLFYMKFVSKEKWKKKYRQKVEFSYIAACFEMPCCFGDVGPKETLLNCL